MSLVRYITNNSTPPWHIQPLIHRIKELLQQIPNWGMFHIYKEANQLADALANFAADKTQTLGHSATRHIWIDRHPTFLNNYVIQDQLGLTFQHVLKSYLSFT